MKTRIVAIFLHITAWVVFLSLPYIFRPKGMGPNIVLPDHQMMFIRFMAFNLYIIALFYLHGYWMLPRLAFKRHWLAYIVILISLFLGFILLRDYLFARKPPGAIPMGFKPGFGPTSMRPSRFEFVLFKPEPWNAAFLFIVILFISGGFRIVDEWMKAEKKAKLIENERMTMELSLLRAQINPHFLFNTLNTIYSMALMKSDTTAEAVMKLSDIMHYMTEESSSDKVALQKEVDYIVHFAELQRIRLGESTPIRLNIEGDFSGFEIPPLILMPFMENALRYGISNHEKAGIEVSLQLNQGVLFFTVSNRIFRNGAQTTTPGLGIRKTRQRLDLLYPDRHTLDIIDDGKMFTVNMEIRLA